MTAKRSILPSLALLLGTGNEVTMRLTCEDAMALGPDGVPPKCYVFRVSCDKLEVSKKLDAELVALAGNQQGIGRMIDEAMGEMAVAVEQWRARNRRKAAR